MLVILECPAPPPWLLLTRVTFFFSFGSYLQECFLTVFCLPSPAPLISSTPFPSPILVWFSPIIWSLNSAGVGRTGVFCAVSILIERLKAEAVVDVFHTVKQLREQRPAMVQTKVSLKLSCLYCLDSVFPKLS